MTTPVSALSVQATLIDDHLLLDRPPVYPQLTPGCFAVARPDQGTGIRALTWAQWGPTSAEQQGSFFVIGWNQGGGCWDLCASVGFDDSGGGLGIGVTTFRLGPPADSANSFGVAWSTTDEIWYSDAQLTTTGSGPGQGFDWSWIGNGPQCFAPGIGALS